MVLVAKLCVPKTRPAAKSAPGKEGIEDLPPLNGRMDEPVEGVEVPVDVGR